MRKTTAFFSLAYNGQLIRWGTVRMLLQHHPVAPMFPQRTLNLFPLPLDAWSELAEDIELKMQRSNLGQGLGEIPAVQYTVHKQPFSRKSLTFRVCKCPVHLVSPNHCCFARPIFLYELAPQRMALLSTLPTHSLTYYVNLEKSKIANLLTISP